MYEEAKEKLKGVVAVLPTPWTETYEVDCEGIKKLVKFLLNSGYVEGKGVLFAACGGGEGPFMNIEEVKLVTETVIDTVKNKIPVFFGSFFNDYKSNLELIKFGEDIGAFGLQIAPFYYQSPTLEEIYQFYKKLNNSTNLGIIVYNNYYSTGTDMPFEFIEKLNKLDKLIGIKWDSTDSSNELYTITKFKNRYNFLSNNVGAFVSGAIAGSKAIISILANIAPKYELVLWDLLEKEDYVKAHNHMMKITLPLYTYLGYQEKRGIGFIPNWKAALEICGKPSGGPRPPQLPLNEENKIILKKILSNAGII